ncbi:MAG: phosphatase PAP2 family protein [Candidatus Cohnella colombiensis]|uniref:Phosphatase PAP2 family protein n=1 Tax=Candidatus Cohnella colombiensis TaxID=3121368 RepID=A0AA95JD70_9BACL|nr:MAG: phosphatase PAP2 family protein [Cohnella sp.]
MQNTIRRLSLLCTLVFAIIAIFVSMNGTAYLDEKIIASIQGLQSDTLTSIMTAITSLASEVGITLISIASVIIIFMRFRRRREILLLISVVCGSALLNKVFKLLFARERPDFNRLIEEAGYSFPSGHSMAAFSLYGILCYIVWENSRERRWRLISLLAGAVIIVMIGISRIYLGVHYPSDVIGGYFATAALLFLIVSLYPPKRKEPVK